MGIGGIQDSSLHTSQLIALTLPLNGYSDTPRLPASLSRGDFPVKRRNRAGARNGFETLYSTANPRKKDHDLLDPLIPRYPRHDDAIFKTPAFPLRNV